MGGVGGRRICGGAGWEEDGGINGFSSKPHQSGPRSRQRTGYGFRPGTGPMSQIQARHPPRCRSYLRSVDVSIEPLAGGYPAGLANGNKTGGPSHTTHTAPTRSARKDTREQHPTHQCQPCGGITVPEYKPCDKAAHAASAATSPTRDEQPPKDGAVS